MVPNTGICFPFLLSQPQNGCSCGQMDKIYWDEYDRAWAQDAYGTLGRPRGFVAMGPVGPSVWQALRYHFLLVPYWFLSPILKSSAISLPFFKAKEDCSVHAARNMLGLIAQRHC